MLWSVSMQAAGDRPLTHEEIVELADAVAPAQGVASGIGRRRTAPSSSSRPTDRDEAIALGQRALRRAAATAGLPAWPVSAVGRDLRGEDVR